MADEAVDPAENRWLPLTKCPAADIERLTHGIVNKLCGQKGPEFKDFQAIFSINEWVKVQRELSDLIRRTAGHCNSNEEMKTEIESSGLPSETSIAIRNAITIRSNDIRRALVSQSSTISQATLKDFDWKVKLILSSDKMANLREAVASVDFDLDTEDGRKLFSVEMSKMELDLLINKLEAANKVVQQLRA